VETRFYRNILIFEFSTKMLFLTTIKLLLFIYLFFVITPFLIVLICGTYILGTSVLWSKYYDAIKDRA